MENNKEKTNINKTSENHDVLMPLIFGILAVVIMAIAAHFVGG